MKRQSGFSLIEVLIVIIILAILTITTLFSLNSYTRQTKTEMAASAIFSLMRRARIQSINTRQYCAVVINTSSVDTTMALATPGGNTLPFLSRSVSLVSMGQSMAGDEVLRQTNKLPIDVFINQASGGPLAANSDAAFNTPEKNFSAFDPTTMNGVFVIFFDPAGRAVDAPSNTGNFVYSRLYFSSFDISRAVPSSPLLRALTIYGASGGVKYWRYIPGAMPSWQFQLN